MHLVAQLYADPADCSGKPQRSLKAEVNAGQGAMDRSREECPAQQALHSRCRGADPSYHHVWVQQPHATGLKPDMLDSDLHRTNYSTQSHHCCCKVIPMADTAAPRCSGKRNTICGLWDLLKVSAALSYIFYPRWSISGQIPPEFTLTCKWMHFQSLKWQQAHFLHQAADSWPLWIQNACTNTTDVLQLSQV